MYTPHLPLSLWERVRVRVRVREKKGRYVHPPSSPLPLGEGEGEGKKGTLCTINFMVLKRNLSRSHPIQSFSISVKIIRRLFLP
jgi:hypothetical protein